MSMRPVLAFGILIALTLGNAALAQQPTFAKAGAACDWQPPPRATSGPDSSRVFTGRERGLTHPKLRCSVDPQYSNEARKKKLQGVSTISLVVDATGMPTDVKVAKSIGDGVAPKLQKSAATLDANAIDAVSQYRFDPATYEGQPVAYKLNIEVNFRLY